MGPQSFHALKRIIERSKRRASSVHNPSQRNCVLRYDVQGTDRRVSVVVLRYGERLRARDGEQAEGDGDAEADEDGAAVISRAGRLVVGAWGGLPPS